MYRLPSCAECIPPTWLALGLDQSLSSLLPAWYQFWSFRAAPPSQFRWGQRTDLSPRGRVPPIPEVPGRALTPDSSKRLHIHCSVVIHAGTAVPLYASRRSTCTTVSGLSRFRRTMTRPLSNTLVMSTGSNHGNFSFVPRVRSSVMS